MGVKYNQLRALRSRGADVILVRHDATLEDVLALRPDGVLLSNGPGDPVRLDGPVALTRALLERGVPLLGICLGHQVLGRAIGATTSRLPFGHHGGNHPVGDRERGTVSVTSHNHEFQVDADSIPVRERLVRQRAQPQRPERRGPAPPRPCLRSACSTTPRGRPAPRTAPRCSTSSCACAAGTRRGEPATARRCRPACSIMRCRRRSRLLRRRRRFLRRGASWSSAAGRLSSGRLLSSTTPGRRRAAPFARRGFAWCWSTAIRRPS